MKRLRVLQSLGSAMISKVLLSLTSLTLRFTSVSQLIQTTRLVFCSTNASLKAHTMAERI